MFKFLKKFFGADNDKAKQMGFHDAKLNQICHTNHYMLANYIGKNKLRARSKTIGTFEYSKSISSYIGLTYITTYHNENGTIVYFD